MNIIGIFGNNYEDDTKVIQISTGITYGPELIPTLDFSDAEWQKFGLLDNLGVGVATISLNAYLWMNGMLAGHDYRIALNIIVSGSGLRLKDKTNTYTIQSLASQSYVLLYTAVGDGVSIISTAAERDITVSDFSIKEIL